MRVSDAKGIFTASLQAGDSVLMTGLHGIGKTEVVKEWAKENNIYLEVLYLSQQEVGDLIGVPYNREENGVMIEDWSIPTWLNNMNQASKEGKITALFLDELSRAPLDIRQAALQLVLDKRIHQHNLPTTNGVKTLIIAADNPDNGDYQVESMDPALLDRFLNLEVEVDVQAWLDWARKNGVNNIVRSFIADNPSKLYFKPESSAKDPKGSTPRGWTKLAAFVDNFSNIARELHHPVIKGKIGSALALQFLNYYNNYTKMVSVEDIETLTKKIYKPGMKMEDLGNAVKELTREVEVVQKTELCTSLVEKYSSGKVEDAIPMMGMLYSLEVEILSAFFKKYSRESNDKYLKIADFDMHYNKKGLFVKLIDTVL